MWSAGGITVVVLACLALLPWTSLSRKLETETRLPRALMRLIAGGAKALAAARSLLTPGVLSLGFLLGLVAWGLVGLGVYALGSMLAAVHLAPATGDRHLRRRGAGGRSVVPPGRSWQYRRR